MITDRLENHALYHGLSDDIKVGLECLAGLDESIELGSYEVSDRIYVIISTYETGAPPFDGYEAHRNCIDIQYPMRGREAVLWSPLVGMRVIEPYNAAIDRAIWSAPVQPTEVITGNGVFAIFFPEDAHRPCLPAPEGVETVLKVTIKIKVES